MTSRKARRRGRRLALALATVLATIGGVLGSPLTASAAVGVPVTYVDHAYAATVTRPSADKPQSKLWYLDGSWWGLLVVAGGTQVHIHELMPDHTWRDTGAVVDTRLNSSGDALWDSASGKLFVVSRADGSNLQVGRFSYTAATRTWVRDGSPVTVNSGGGSESASIDRDSLGRLWVTYTQGSRVYVAHSDASGGNWTAGFLPPVSDTSIKSDDLSAVIAFGTSIGVMYSDQVSGKFWFAIHDDADPDSVWRLEDATANLLSVDDHINLKQLVGDPQGRIFAAVKTSANDPVGAKPTDPLVGVLTRTGPSGGVGTWSFATAGTVADDHTRPIIMIDSTNQQLYFFATSPGNGGDIVYKKSPLSAVSFPSGRGAPFVDAAPVVNNASGAKDPVTAQTGLVILAVAEGQKRYVHGEMQLPGGGGDTTPPTATVSPAAGATNVPATTDVTATFSESVQGVDGSSFTLATGTGAAVTATVTYSDATKVATLHPGATLAASSQYAATLTSAIHDASNNALGTRTWSFTTAAAGSGGDTQAPTVASRVPAVGATGVPATANVVATFSEAVQGVTTSTFTLTDPAGGALPAALTSDSTSTTWTLDPVADLAPGTQYTATLTGGPSAIRDLSDNGLVSESWTFTTAAPSDTVAPTVTAKTPAAGATGFSRTGSVTATFSEAVQNVTIATFVLRNTGTGATVTAVVSRNSTTNKWVLNPSSTLPARTKFTATIVGGANGVTDLAGNPLAAGVSWTFTTGV